MTLDEKAVKIARARLKARVEATEKAYLSWVALLRQTLVQ